MGIGKADERDCELIVYGDKALHDRDKRGWVDHVTGKTTPIIGVFDPKHPDPRSEYLRTRVHAVGFVSGSGKGGINSIKLYKNPNLDTDIRDSWPLKGEYFLGPCASHFYSPSLE